jgi:hypothetical protein
MIAQKSKMFCRTNVKLISNPIYCRLGAKCLRALTSVRNAMAVAHRKGGPSFVDLEPGLCGKNALLGRWSRVLGNFCR